MGLLSIVAFDINFSKYSFNASFHPGIIFIPKSFKCLFSKTVYLGRIIFELLSFLPLLTNLVVDFVCFIISSPNSNQLQNPSLVAWKIPGSFVSIISLICSARFSVKVGVQISSPPNSTISLFSINSKNISTKFFDLLPRQGCFPYNPAVRMMIYFSSIDDI